MDADQFAAGMSDLVREYEQAQSEYKRLEVIRIIWDLVYEQRRCLGEVEANAGLPKEVTRDQFIELVLDGLEEYAKLGPNHRQMGPSETKLIYQIEEHIKARHRSRRARGS